MLRGVVGYILLMDVSFGVTMRISGFGGGDSQTLGDILDILGQMIRPFWYLADWEVPEAHGFWNFGARGM